MSNLRVNSISARAGSGVIAVPSGNTLGQAGLVVQTVQKFFDTLTVNNSNQVYVAVANGDLSITTKIANSKILALVSAQGYQSAGGGCNIGLQRTVGGVTTRLLGVDGAAGDSWLGFGNGVATSSWNMKRELLDSPNVAAGTTLTYQALLGRWSSGTIYFNYSGYTGGSTITLLEIAP